MSACLRVIAAALLLFAAGGARAQALQEYEYQPDRIYPVRTGLGITTQIELSSNELVLDYSTGFSSGWDLTRRDNVFYLKPKNVDVDTNMVVRTATHAYIFELKVVATDWRALEQARQAGVQYRITFRYPADAKFIAERAPTPAADARIEQGRPYNFDYSVASRTRERWLVPANVYDDGRFTYVRMPVDNTLLDNTLPIGNFPAVFARQAEDGEDFVVNTSIEGDTIVVHGTYPYLVIRHGRNVVGLRRNPSK
ncbi:MAG TPA: TrbG/VirB9 family P-type conjugative transfer protein [Luteimonas sp.]|nr:TrbG/VirB9 family P-type conjugative transfer protein [Luteimonas sp.]